MIKIHFHEKNATIRWKNPAEKEFLRRQLVTFRDAMKQVAPISVKDEHGHEMPSIRIPIQPTKPADIVSLPTPVVEPEKTIEKVVP